MVLALTIVAGILGVVGLVRSKAQDLNAWGICALALALLWNSLPLR